MSKKQRLSEEESLALARQIDFTPDEIKMLKKRLKGDFDETDGEQVKVMCSLIDKMDAFWVKVGADMDERDDACNLSEWFYRKYYSVIEKEKKAAKS